MLSWHRTEHPPSIDLRDYRTTSITTRGCARCGSVPGGSCRIDARVQFTRHARPSEADTPTIRLPPPTGADKLSYSDLLSIRASQDDDNTSVGNFRCGSTGSNPYLNMREPIMLLSRYRSDLLLSRQGPSSRTPWASAYLHATSQPLPFLYCDCETLYHRSY